MKILERLDLCNECPEGQTTCPACDSGDGVPEIPGGGGKPDPKPEG